MIKFCWFDNGNLIIFLLTISFSINFNLYYICDPMLKTINILNKRAKFDYEIINDGTLEDLMDKVREILVKEKII